MVMAAGQKVKVNCVCFGHHNGVVSVSDVVEGAGEIGIDYLTLYTFSAENWNRPKLKLPPLWNCW
jgi:undecaprenyl diphosphate synthase